MERRVSAYWWPQTPLCREFANGNRLSLCRAGAGAEQESGGRGREAKWPRISDNFAGKASDLESTRGGLRLSGPCPGHRGASGPAAQMLLSPARRAPGGLQREQDAKGSPAREGEGQPPVCPRHWEGRCVGGHPAPDAPSLSRGTRDYSSDAGKRRAEPGMLARQSGKPAPPPQDHVP